MSSRFGPQRKMISHKHIQASNSPMPLSTVSYIGCYISCHFLSMPQVTRILNVWTSGNLKRIYPDQKHQLAPTPYGSTCQRSSSGSQTGSHSIRKLWSCITLYKAWLVSRSDMAIASAYNGARQDLGYPTYTPAGCGPAKHSCAYVEKTGPYPRI